MNEHINSEVQVSENIAVLLEKIKQHTGSVKQFWADFLKLGSQCVRADRMELWIKEPAENWRASLSFSSSFAGNRTTGFDKTQVILFAEQVNETGDDTCDGSKGEQLIGIKLDIEKGKQAVLFFFFSRQNRVGKGSDREITVKLIAQVPSDYQQFRLAEQSRSDVVHFHQALDLMTLLNSETRFMALAMAFVNEVASRYQCQRVSLGWLEKNYIRVQAISHMDKFEKKMEAVQLLEAAMEESFDQDEEIVFPRITQSGAIIRDHEQYAIKQGIRHMVSIPIRLGDQVVGVVLCERDAQPFSLGDIQGLRIICDQAARRIAELKQTDRWFGSRLLSWGKLKAGALIGPEHTGSKIIGILVCLALAFLIFFKWDYRVEATFVLETDDLSYLPAPFDGYIDRVHVRVGDRVDESGSLLSLDTRELYLEESSALADLSRYQREMEKARAENALADMKIAKTLKMQAQAKLDLIRYTLGNAEVNAPFNGIVVEGDLKKMLGAPVRKGDILFKVARIEKMYAKIKVDEKQIHEIKQNASGEVTFLSRPDEEFAVSLERIEPLAVSEEAGNFFIVRARFKTREALWFRPGMSGVAKIDVEKRRLIWIFTHRTVSFLRLFFWW